MHEPTTTQPTCKECGQPLERKSRGPAPTYCSANCRAKAGNRRAKAEGRYQQWRQTARAKKQTQREANAKPCPYCGEPMLNPRRVQCGKPECKRLYTNERAKKFHSKWKAENGQRYNAKFTYEHTCEVCGKTWRSGNKNARYCSTSCTNTLARYERTCESCGKQWLAKQVTARWCSPECAAAWRTKINIERKLPVPLKERPPRAWCRLPERHPARLRIPRPRLFVQGNCLLCGQPFCAYSEVGTASYCSRRCQRKDAKDRRRARERSAYVEPVNRLTIFERDRWICQLCGKPTKPDAKVPHPLAPVLDHIIPLAAGGTHEQRNAQCAHFICNSRKRDRGSGEQLMLIG